MDEKNVKWFRSEVAVAFAIGSVVAGVLTYFMSYINPINTQIAVIQNQIAELKSNDLVHIELEQKAISTVLKEQGKQVSEIENKLVEVLVILREK